MYYEFRWVRRLQKANSQISVDPKDLAEALRRIRDNFVCTENHGVFDRCAWSLLDRLGVKANNEYELTDGQTVMLLSDRGRGDDGRQRFNLYMISTFVEHLDYDEDEYTGRILTKDDNKWHYWPDGDTVAAIDFDATTGECKLVDVRDRSPISWDQLLAYKAV